MLALHKREFVGQRERSAREDQLAAGQGVYLRGPVDRPHDVAMLRGAREGGELQAALREENCSSADPKSVDGFIDCRDLDPAVAGFARPRRAGEDDEPTCRSRRQAATALADMREANGWVASITASMRSRARNAAKPSGPPKPPMR